MFSKAIQKVSQYTHPVIISKRLYNKDVKCGCGTFIVLNEDGWILTASHLLDSLLIYKKHQQEIQKFNIEKQKILKDNNLTIEQKNKRIKRLKPNDKWIINQSFWWSKDQVRINEFKIDKMIDIAVGKLEPFDGFSQYYPTLKNPTKEFLVGTSLCRLGFPFHKVKASFDEKTNSFKIADGVLPMPRFPNDGIHTRIAIRVDKQSKRKVEFIETSSPGLRGQSGGPIFDTEGNLWGLQSRTFHLPLGFSPKIKIKNKEFEEQQFLNVGIGAHVKEIIKFLDKHGIKYTTSE